MRWLLDVVVNWSTIILFFYIAVRADGFWTFLTMGFLIGSRLHALALLGHDGAHRLAVPNRAINDFLTDWLIAYPLFVVTEGYREWHFEHHRHLGTAKDPELDSYRGQRPYVGKLTAKKVVGVFLLDLTGFGFFGLLKFMKAVFPRRRPSLFLGPIIFWIVFAVATFGTGRGWIFGLYVYSIVGGFWAIFRFRSWTEHVGVAREGKENSHRFATNRLVRYLFFPHNTHCHYEHHRWSQVPYYNLPKLREKSIARRILPLRAIFSGSYTELAPAVRKGRRNKSLSRFRLINQSGQ